MMNLFENLEKGINNIKEEMERNDLFYKKIEDLQKEFEEIIYNFKGTDYEKCTKEMQKTNNKISKKELKILNEEKIISIRKDVYRNLMIEMRDVIIETKFNNKVDCETKISIIDLLIKTFKDNYNIELDRSNLITIKDMLEISHS